MNCAGQLLSATGPRTLSLCTRCPLKVTPDSERASERLKGRRRTELNEQRSILGCLDQTQRELGCQQPFERRPSAPCRQLEEAERMRDESRRRCACVGTLRGRSNEAQAVQEGRRVCLRSRCECEVGESSNESDRAFAEVAQTGRALQHRQRARIDVDRHCRESPRVAALPSALLICAPLGSLRACRSCADATIALADSRSRQPRRTTGLSSSVPARALPTRSHASGTPRRTLRPWLFAAGR